MPALTVHLTSPSPTSFRAEQIAGLFDVPLDERLAHTLTAEVPSLDEDWKIGAIVGPSGSGKTTLARAAFGDAIYEPQPWPADQPIIDVLGHSQRTSDLPIKDLLRVLTAVGLSSPPAWLKPYGVLSTGERFRADLARAVLTCGERDAGHHEVVASRHGNVPDDDRLATQRHRETYVSRSPAPLLVIDEFTSTLDRTVACTASAALSKFLRSPPVSNLKSEICNLKSPPRLVAVTCHTDLLPWLAPDWVLDLTGDPQTGGPRLTRGCLRRPQLRLRVARVPQSLWPRFARHHYLSGGLATAATCYAAFAEGRGLGVRARGDGNDFPSPSPQPSSRPVAFCAVLATLGWKNRKRITRLVVLPEFQGLGIGPQLAETVARHEQEKGHRVSITASHPAILGHMSRSPRWRYLGLKKTGSTRQQLGTRAIRCSTGRAVASFEYVG